MKHLLLSFIFLSSSFAFACPDLTGLYDCGPRGTLELTRYSDGYEFNEKGKITFMRNDNKTYHIDETTTYSSFCEEKSFHIRLNFINENVGPVAMETAFFIDSDNNLAQLGGIRYDVDGKEKMFPYGNVCPRIK